MTALDQLFEGLPERLSVEQLTDLLGLSSTAVTYRLLRDGDVPAIRLRKHWLILRDDVKEHMRAQYNTPRTEPPSQAVPERQEHNDG